MGILKNLLVLGSAKFANVIKGTVEHAQNGIYYGTCSTAGATAAKVITLDDPAGFELKPGVMIAVKFSISNSAANATLNVEGTGAKGIWYGTSAFTRADTWVNGAANKTFIYVYDGTYWVWVSKGDDTNSDTYTSAYCSTASATAAKTASCSGYYLVSALSKSYIHVIIVSSNTAASALTLNINSQGAKPIYINGSASSSTNYTLPAGSYIAFYDGTNYHFRTDGKLPASITGDAGTVNGHTVSKDVPSDAVFTDTKDLTQMTGTLAIDHGGTGATTASAARTNLGLKALATKDSASGTYTPAGSVGTPTITVTPNTATVNSITSVGELPSLDLSVTGEKLIIDWSAGTLPAKGSNQTVVTSIKSATSTQPSWTGTQATITVS